MRWSIWPTRSPGARVSPMPRRTCPAYTWGRCWRYGLRGRKTHLRKEKGMFRWLIRRQLDRFEKEYDYDLSYAREILDISTRAAFKLGRVMGFGSYREDVPRDASFATGLAGTLAEDCGP